MKHLQIETPPMNDMNGWFIYFSNQPVQPSEAFQHLLQPSVKFGSKSTASLFLLAYRYVLSTPDQRLMDQLLEKMSETTVPNQVEFSRKLAFRLLTNDKPDKVMVLLTAVVLYPRLYNQLPTVSPSESVGAVQQFRAAHLALTSMRQSLLVTVDVRLMLLRNPNYSIIFRWMFALVDDILGDDSSVNVSSQECLDQAISVLDVISKSLCDYFLIIERNDIPPLIQMGLLKCLIQLSRSLYPNVLDHCYRAISYLYEFSSREVAAEHYDNCPFFDGLLSNLQAEKPQIVLTTLQHCATHLIPRIPRRLRQTFMTQFNRLRTSQPPDHAIQTHALRCMHVMGSTGIRIGIVVLYRENVEGRRSKQVWMHRQCEGCQKRETEFGEFMMCAGCRKVRYCSKECQVKDWRFHRMSCQFFRPRPGFRSRGNNTSVDGYCQTNESSFMLTDDHQQDSSSNRGKTRMRSDSQQQFDDPGSMSRATLPAMMMNTSITNTELSQTASMMDIDGPSHANSTINQQQQPHANDSQRHRSRDSSSSSLDAIEPSSTSESYAQTDQTFPPDLNSWRHAEYTSTGSQTVQSSFSPSASYL